MSTTTPSPPPCASPCRDSANASANPGPSPPCPASATASTRNQTPRMREETVDRPPGLSVRLKLTLSYAGFLMLAGALLLAVVWVLLLRYVPNAGGLVPDGEFLLRGSLWDLGRFWLSIGLRSFGPVAAI